MIRALLSTDIPNGPYIEFHSDELHGGTVVDSKGNPYHIALDGDGDGAVGMDGKVISQRIAIWANGTNGKNEFGEGDDLNNWE